VVLHDYALYKSTFTLLTYFKLDHAIIAVAVHQWHRHLSACIKASDGHFKHCL